MWRNRKNCFICLKAENGTGSLLLAGIEYIYTSQYNQIYNSDCDVDGDVVCASDAAMRQRRPALPCTRCLTLHGDSHRVLTHHDILKKEKNWRDTGCFFPGKQPQTSELRNEFDLLVWFQSATKKKKVGQQEAF